MQKVAVVGAGGRMGQEVCRAVSVAADLELVAAVDPGHAGEWSRASPSRPTIRSLVASGAEVVVDFTVAEAARDNLAFYAERGCMPWWVPPG